MNHTNANQKKAGIVILISKVSELNFHGQTGTLHNNKGVDFKIRHINLKCVCI